ncbi:uncharacterized protein HMPREF1541_08379 [Cyphellophora europaea CBS 101466]|uniref:SWI5-dependent HO expression protein 3 n=1 Tax=Cyphellophora europaea (strain CBS 101466) TaxID=1220924 RepID=W2RNZ0_CYPE1|nr:uncharacterized protein HMPREF1541_08379 [Cyphellophora europaea CBS 101466]ETN37388.1 hypothetical protein HMPREF1541_08379 [Cyphellophora europaea CBS 101466]
MAAVNGYTREQSPLSPPEMQRTNTGRVASITRTGMAMITLTTERLIDNKTAAIPPDQSPTTENAAWSSAIGHANTGKSGRVIERLQSDIDRLHREKQLLKMRHDETEKANETLNARNQYLQDRNSNYEQSHEASLRQLARKERQLEDLREELNRERERTGRAEEQARAASMTEEQWRDQASHAKAVAQQKESEYDVIVSCRNMDNDRHQSGLDKIKGSFETLLRQREEDLEKQRKLEIIAEQQRQTIAQLEELTKKLSSNFKTYRNEIDSAVSDLRKGAEGNNTAMAQKLQDMTETTGRMKWVMNIDGLFNGNPRVEQIMPPPVEAASKDSTGEVPPSPTKSPGRRHKLLKRNTKSGR